MEKNPMINIATKIAENMFDNSPMVTGQAMHELRELIDHISNVWLGQC